MYRNVAWALSVGALFLIWKLFGPEWLFAAIGAAVAYQIYHRIRYGAFIESADQ